MKQQETAVWKEIRIASSPMGFRLFRNQRYKGQIVHKGVITNGYADCGLCDGSGDLIGYQIVTITPEMIGQKFARFVSIETKHKGTSSGDQDLFINAVINNGGIAGICRSVEDFKKLLLTAV